MKTKITNVLLFSMILGATLLVGAQVTVKTVIQQEKCVGCGDCVRNCPVEAITLVRGKAVIDPQKCVGCRTCVLVCSYGAPR